MREAKHFVLAGAAILLSMRAAVVAGPPGARQSPGDSASQAPALVVTRERVCRGEISPFQCGQFIEYLCALTPSMFAEKVCDGSFEGVPPYGVAFRSQTDRVEQPWYPDGAVHRGEFTLDATDPANGKVSQRIRQKPGDPCTLGISQGGMYVKAGEALCCALFLRAEGIEHPVCIALWGPGKTYATAEFRPGPRWQRYQATLRPAATDTRATLTISYRGPGTLWIDQVSLMPTATVCGWRSDVAEAVKALRPGIIRFGGSTIEGFEWTATIGDPAKRVPFTTCWGGLEPGNAGLEEFVQLCRWAGAQPLVCVRFSGKKPQDAADQVEYFNGPATSRMGRLRAANGHAEPYGVRYWQVGNELGDEPYQKGLAAFCKAMKAVDPGIKLLASFPSAGLLQNAGAHIDYVCPHHYGCHNLGAMEASVASCRRMIEQYAPGRGIRLAVTEWNTTAGDWQLGRAMLWTLDNALWCSRYHNFMHRHCDLIEIANRSNLADSFCSGIIQTNNSSLFKTPTYYAQQLYALHAGSCPLKILGDHGSGRDATLDTSATLSADGRRLALFAVNPTRQSQKRSLDLTALVPAAAEASVWTLADTARAGERDAANSWREPERIRVQPGKAALAGGKLVYEFPALSLTVLEAACDVGSSISKEHER
jgi:alpha-N-arabinofuranosidase